MRKSEDASRPNRVQRAVTHRISAKRSMELLVREQPVRVEIHDPAARAQDEPFASIRINPGSVRNGVGPEDCVKLRR